MMEFKPNKGWLQDKVIPVDANGDPAFRELGIAGFGTSECSSEEVLGQFTPEQVVYLVNKQLYALTYQREFHKKRAARETELLAPVKAKLKELYPGVSWIKATEEQQRAAVDAVRKDQEERKDQV